MMDEPRMHFKVTDKSLYNNQVKNWQYDFWAIIIRISIRINTLIKHTLVRWSNILVQIYRQSLKNYVDMVVFGFQRGKYLLTKT